MSAPHNLKVQVLMDFLHVKGVLGDGEDIFKLVCLFFLHPSQQGALQKCPKTEAEDADVPEIP